MIYTIDELRKRITPVAEKYQLRAVYLFGSYARNEATDNSDVDILVDRTGSIIKGIIYGSFYNELCESVGKEIDLVTTDALAQDDVKRMSPLFVKSLMKEKVTLYEG